MYCVCIQQVSFQAAPLHHTWLFCYIVPPKLLECARQLTCCWSWQHSQTYNNYDLWWLDYSFNQSQNTNWDRTFTMQFCHSLWFTFCCTNKYVYHRCSENLIFHVHLSMPFQPSIRLFFMLRFIRNIIAIYKPAKVPVRCSHDRLAGGKHVLCRCKTNNALVIFTVPGHN